MNSLFYSRIRELGVIAGVIVLAGLTGCSGDSEDRLPVYSASGQVLLEGKPLPHAFIVLHPRDASDKRVLPARGQTDENGNFQLTTYQSGDGAVEGEFAVTVQHYPTRKEGESVVPGPNVLPPRYANPATTDIKVNIAAGSNQLEPINLLRR